LNRLIDPVKGLCLNIPMKSSELFSDFDNLETDYSVDVEEILESQTLEDEEAPLESTEPEALESQEELQLGLDQLSDASLVSPVSKSRSPAVKRIRSKS